MSAINVLGVFARHQLTGKAMPKLEWKHADVDGRPSLRVTANPAPKSASLWVAQAATHDFRAASWQKMAAEINADTITGGIDRPLTGSTAFYATMEYDFEGVPYSLSTQLRIVDALSKSAP